MRLGCDLSDTAPEEIHNQGGSHDKDVLRVHHDALEFPDGTFVLLTDLHEGQQATVLQLPVQPKTPAEAKAETRVVYVG